MDETGDSSVLLVARCLIAGLFLWSGVGQLSGLDETAMFVSHGTGYMNTLFWAAVVTELVGAVLLILGFKARFVCLILAGFSVVTALLFHANFPDRAQMFHFLKNFAIAGGLLALYVAGPGRLSFDGMGEPRE